MAKLRKLGSADFYMFLLSIFNRASFSNSDLTFRNSIEHFDDFFNDDKKIDVNTKTHTYIDCNGTCE